MIFYFEMLQSNAKPKLDFQPNFFCKEHERKLIIQQLAQLFLVYDANFTLVYVWHRRIIVLRATSLGFSRARLQNNHIKCVQI